jgi:2-(3-amino-3-carboxypropyl)histidine synthase
MDYDFELERVVEEINKKKAKKVCIQLADGLKPHSRKIVDKLEENTQAKIFVWLGSCYGGCDVPPLKNFDLLVQFGHNEYLKAVK